MVTSEEVIIYVLVYLFHIDCLQTSLVYVIVYKVIASDCCWCFVIVPTHVKLFKTISNDEARAVLHGSVAVQAGRSKVIVYVLLLGLLCIDI